MWDVCSVSHHKQHSTTEWQTWWLKVVAIKYWIYKKLWFLCYCIGWQRPKIFCQVKTAWRIELKYNIVRAVVLCGNVWLAKQCAVVDNNPLSNLTVPFITLNEVQHRFWNASLSLWLPEWGVISQTFTCFESLFHMHFCSLLHSD